MHTPCLPLHTFNGVIGLLLFSVSFSSTYLLHTLTTLRRKNNIYTDPPYHFFGKKIGRVSIIKSLKRRCVGCAGVQKSYSNSTRNFPRSIDKIDLFLFFTNCSNSEISWNSITVSLITNLYMYLCINYFELENDFF